MNYFDVINDLKTMKGVLLQSINPGANITITEINDKNIILENSSGNTVIRPLSEIKRIVEAMASGSPVHVDTVLEGSGSSRNQPETMLANLSYVEWLKIKNKKHIICIKENSHPLGTLKKMDEINECIVKAEFLVEESIKGLVVTVVFCTNIQQGIDFYSRVYGFEIKKANLNYSFLCKGNQALLLRLSPSEFNGFVCAPLMLVGNLEEERKRFSGEKQVRFVGNYHLPEQVLVTNRCGYSIVLAEKVWLP